MGNCCSGPTIPDNEPPKCGNCGVTGTIAWGKLSASQRRSFWIESKEGGLVCQQCVLKERMDHRRQHSLKEREAQERMREKLKEVKEAKYPRVETKKRLKTIPSGEGWEGTSSFYEHWRPASFISHLVGLARKSTGAPHAGTTPPAAAAAAPDCGDTLDGAEGSSRGGSSSSAAANSERCTHRHRQEHLDQIQEELMVAVEEESLSGSEARSGVGEGVELDGEHDEEGRPVGLSEGSEQCDFLAPRS